ncbi:hypothetical protein LDL59_04480 [Kaistella anthropi]|nr:hypothetical protein [Kaistella anthropi]
MLKIEGGSYRPFVGKESDSLTFVNSFLMDETAVTNAEFLEFLKKNPQWHQKPSSEVVCRQYLPSFLEK